MPTKFLVVETPSFQLGANAGEKTERVDPAAFPARFQKHVDETKAGANDLLFVLAPSELRLQSAFSDVVSGDAPVSLAYFASQQDALRFLPSLLAFDGADRSGGAKEFLGKGSTIYSETIFNGKAVGTKLDPCYVFARQQLTANAAASAWACLQALVFLGIQHLPEAGEKGTGEKVDVQLGADDRFLAVNVRFPCPPEKYPFLRANSILGMPRVSSGIFELRYVAAGGSAELTCLFPRAAGETGRTVEITSWQPSSALENGAEVKDYQYKTFGAIPGEGESAPKKVGGFKKKFSDQVKVKGGGTSTEDSTTVSGGAPASAETLTTIGAGNAPYKDHKVMVSGNASLVPDKETVFKNENAANRVIELEARLIDLEAQLKTRDSMLASANKELKDLNDPLKKRDVLTNIKDTQSEGLKQTVKNLETELEEAKNREKELMKMVDKAVQMKDEAAKKIKELDLKLKQASSGGGSKVQMLEKALDEQKRQNKELSKKINEMSEKLKAA